MRKFIAVIILLLISFVYSCKQGTDYYSVPKSIIDYSVFVNEKLIDTNLNNTLNYNDTTELILKFKESIDVSELIISIPSNIICDIYFNDNCFNSNKHEFIYNAEEIFLNKENSIPISPENIYVKMHFDNNAIIKAGDKFSFVIFKSSFDIEKLKLINFYSKKQNYKNYSTKELEIETKQYFTETKLPVIKINTNKILSDTKNVFGNFEVYNGKQTNYLKESSQLSSNLKIKIRGQSSKYYRKQSYKITSLNSDSTNNNIELLGLPKENDWILYAPYWDESLIRNNLAFQLWREMGYYSPRTKYIELVINNDYRGIYVLTEKIKIDKKRFKLNKLSKKDTSLVDISGGYLFKIDKGPKNCWSSKLAINGYSRCYYYVSPSYKKTNANQRDYIKNYVNEFENALYNDANWHDYIDEKSFIDFIIINELAKNFDAYRLSTYLSKEKNGKLNMGPVWDFDRGFGNEDKLGNNNSDGFIYNLKLVPFWWAKLMSNKEFKSKLIKRYKELRATSLSDKNINIIINDNYNIIKPSIEREALRWRTYTNIEGNPYNAKSIEDAVDYLKNWTYNRAKYLDKEWD